MQITPGLRGAAIFEPSARLRIDRNPISDGGGGEGSVIGLKCLEGRWFGRCLVVTGASGPSHEVACPGAAVQRGSAPILNTSTASIGRHTVTASPLRSAKCCSGKHQHSVWYSTSWRSSSAGEESPTRRDRGDSASPGWRL